MKKIILTTVCFLAALGAFAQTNYVNHIVKEGESLYRISVTYGVPIAEIKANNPDLVGDIVGLGSILKIPLKGTTTAATGPPVAFQPVPIAEYGSSGTMSVDHSKAVDMTEVVAKNPLQGPAEDEMVYVISTPEKKEVPKELSVAVNDIITKEKNPLVVEMEQIAPITHTVAKGETLYAIAKKYNQSVDVIRSWNKIKGNGIKKGDKLVIAWVKAFDEGAITTAAALMPVADVAPFVPTAPVTAFQRKYMDLAEQTSKYTLLKDSGIAIRFTDEKLSPGSSPELVALHRSAPLRSIVKVTNPVNGRSIYVKVIGRVPNNGINSEVILQLPSTAAKALNMLDGRTLVECSYFKKK